MRAVHDLFDLARLEAEEIVATYAPSGDAEEIEAVAADLRAGLATYDHGAAFGREVIAQLRRMALRAGN